MGTVRLIRRRAFLGGLGAIMVTACRAQAGSVTIDESGDKVQTLRRGQWPVFATPDIQPLYRFAVERADELQYFPCFCGCGRMGHKSNVDCYVKAVNADGTITFTSHAAT